MKKKIFLRFFLLSFSSALLVFLVGLTVVNMTTKRVVRERLQAETKLACALVSEKEDFEKFGVYFQNDEFRVSVFDLSGNPLYESDTKALNVLENHSDREEFRLAIEGKSEPIERYSDTFNCKMTYCANLKTLKTGEQVVIRLAVKSSQVRDYVFVSIPLLLAVLGASIILSVLFANKQSELVAHKFSDVGKSLKSLNEGTYLPIYGDDEELGEVYNEINEISASLLSYIVKEEGERKKLETVLSNVAQGIIAIGENKKIAFLNKASKKIFNLQGDVYGEELSALILDKNIVSGIENAEGESSKFECKYLEKDLTIAVRKIVDNALIDSLLYIIIVTDVTQEKEVARQKSEFFANASHELKTPVTVMQGLSEILLSKDLDDSTKRQVERIYKESQRLSALIFDMLKLSRLERGQDAQKEKVLVNLKEVCEEFLSELSQDVNNKKIKATISGNGQILADEKRVYEVIGNLLSNAVNYNKENGDIKIELEETEKEVILKVTDTGIGIEKEHLPRLCERFYRVDKSRSKKTGGTGLGLAIVKHACAIINADLNIDSELGVGTTVTVTFNK